LCGFAFSTHAITKTKTDIIIIAAPNSLKKSHTIDGIVTPNKVYMKCEKAITALPAIKNALKSEKRSFIVMPSNRTFPHLSIKNYIQKYQR